MDEPTQGAGTGGEPDHFGPERVGPFRILEQIGVGGMGIVYLAERKQPLEQRVALKVIRTDRLDKTYRARFAMEQSALARMDHPNIARLLDAGCDGGQSWFAMEYVPGQPLTDYCREHRLSLRDRLALFTQICDGVQHAHIKGILHRDLKPGNILVREVDGRPIAKIIDFGLAQPVDPLQIRATLHEAVQHVVGTLAYMSPEQAVRTEGDLDTRTDVYSLGVVLYELLTGELPIDLDAVRRQGLAWFGEFLREHEPPKPSTRISALGERLSTTAAERRVSPHRLRSLVRGDLDWVTMKALARDRQQRYATVRELGRDVDRFLLHRPVEAGPPSLWHAGKKWCRRHTRVVAAMGVILTTGTCFAWLEVAHAAETARLAMEARLTTEPLIALGLLEAEQDFGLDEESDQAAAVWLTQAEQLLAMEEVHRTRAQNGNAWAAEYVGKSLPRLRTAMDDTRSLRARIAEVRGAMREHSAAWTECCSAMRQNPRYGDCDIAPQFGLAPCGTDPKSGCYEFAVLATGTVPTRGAAGELGLDLDSALILVLVPGGTFVMGTPADDRALGKWSTDAERPVRSRTIAPFFIGKGEVAAQHVVDPSSDPSFWNLDALKDAVLRARKAGARCAVPQLMRGLPISNLSWQVARRHLRRIGLRLPTEEEWEYSARAGTDGPWSCGQELTTLRRHANLPDESAIAAGLRVEETQPELVAGCDGHPAVAPIHSLEANPWGLHDVHGNVAEWCEDAYTDYGTGLPVGIDTRVVRGGSFLRRVQDSRSAARRQLSASASTPDVGMRAARTITRRDTK